MDIKLCDEFYYKIDELSFDFFKSFDTDKQGILRNNETIKFYSGEWIKVKVNDYISHVVKPAETLKNIAEKHNISEEEIIKKNNLKTRKLFIGQILKIDKAKKPLD